VKQYVGPLFQFERIRHDGRVHVTATSQQFQIYGAARNGLIQEPKAHEKALRPHVDLVTRAYSSAARCASGVKRRYHERKWLIRGQLHSPEPGARQTAQPKTAAEK